MSKEQALPEPLASAFVRCLEAIQPLGLEDRRRVLRAIQVVVADAEYEARDFVKRQKHRKGNTK